MRKPHFDKLIQSSIFVFAVSMFTNGLSYIYQIAMGNLMSVSEYGTLNSLLSLSLVLSVPSGILTATTVNASAKYYASNEMAKLTAFLRKITKQAVVFAAIVVLAGIAGSGFIAKILQIETLPYIWAVTLITAVGCVTTVAIGCLQGIQRFAAYSSCNVTAMFLRLVFGVLFAAMGLGVAGGLGALLLSGVGTLLYSVIMLRDVFFSKAVEASSGNDLEFSRYFGYFFWFQFYLLIMTNSDILLVKAFSPSEAMVGIYSSASMIGKIAMYITNSLVVVLFPLVAESKTKGNNPIALLKKSLLWGGVTVVLCSLGMIILGKPMILMLFGERYRPALDLLLPVSFYVIPLSLLTILINYMMPMGHVKFFASSMSVVCVGIIFSVANWCSEVSQILYAIGSGLFIAVIVNYLYIVILNKKSAT